MLILIEMKDFLPVRTAAVQQLIESIHLRLREAVLSVMPGLDLQGVVQKHLMNLRYIRRQLVGVLSLICRIGADIA